jgi:CO dehydrogenase maturation factor
MKIGFVGKGGSGKSTLSWLAARSLAASGRKVLAFDADQNADLAHNLGVEDAASLPWLSGAAAAVHGRFGLPENAKLLDVLETDENVRFTTEPLDPVIEPYARAVSPGIFLVALGQHRDEHLWSGRCSHASAKPAKILLAYLDEAEPWDVIVDSPAGTDMATYGLHLGLDAIVCAVESTRNSQDVARQVAKVAGAFGIPCFSVWTKAAPEDEPPTVEGAPLIGQVPFERAVGSANWESVSSDAKAAAQNVIDALRRQAARADGRARLHAWRAAHRSFVDAR